MNERHLQKMRTYMNICESIASLSYDPKFKVGTVIITDDFREICAVGYNGNYKGGPNARDSEETGGSGFLHSEENALFHLGKPYELRGYLTMLCTHKPCPMCAKRIVNSGLKKVIYKTDYTALGHGADDIFEKSEITCVSIDQYALK
jgi:dCMP deaminase